MGPRDAGPGNHFQESGRNFPRFFETSREGKTGGRMAKGEAVPRTATQRLFRPGCRLIVLSSKQVRMGGSGLHPGEEERIERTETHGAGKSFDRLFRLTQVDFGPSTLVPRQRKVRIQHDRAIEQRGTFINLAGYKGQRMPSLSERKRILVAQQRSAPRQARCLSNHFGWRQPAPDHL